MNVPSWSVGVCICTTLQDVFFIILNVEGSVKADEPTASPNTIGPLDNEAAVRNLLDGKSVPAHLLLKPTGAESRCVWCAMHADTLSAVGLEKTD